MSENQASFSSLLFSVKDNAIKDAYTLYKDLSVSKNAREFLLSIVNLANLHDIRPILEFSYFGDNEIKALSKVCRNAEFIYLTQAIFFYKVYPEKLFNEKLSAEKLMSVKSRLNLLYEFIELFYKALVDIINERRLTKLPDELLHNDLPKGIKINCTQEQRGAIQEALKFGKVRYFAEEHNIEMTYYANNILRAYKYWFNPCRLIDAVMILHYKLTNHNFNMNTTFEQGVADFYKLQSTADCLDLYGYFANNDTCYLMRTMLALQCNIQCCWIELTESKLLAIKKVYESLEIVMHAVRSELLTRHIQTEPYRRDFPRKDIIRPGKRNRDAIIRVTELYDNKEFKENTKITKLFNLLENLIIDRR